MAIGDTVNAGLMRVDFSPIQRAGEAQAKANQAFGQAIGNVLDKFYEKKREKAQQESIADTLVSTFGVNREEANHLSKNKEFIPTFFEQQKAQKDYQLQLDKFNLEEEKYKQALERQEKSDLEKEQERLSENQFFQKLPSLVTDPQAQRQADIARPGLAALGNGDARNRFMQAQLEDPRNQKRVLDLNDRDFLDQFKGDPRQTERALEFIEKRRAAELASQPKVPTPFEAKKYFDESINKMRKEYNSLDEVKAFKPVRAAFLKVKQSAEKPSAAGDLALVFNYMKILDPGSVVREGEFRTAADATAWLQKSEADGVAIPAPIAQAIRKLKDGTILTDDQRKDFVNIARKAASAQFAPVKDSYLQYRNIVNQMQLPESLTLPDNYQMIEDELAGQIPMESSSNAIKTDQGDYSIEGLSVEAQ